MNPLQIFEKHPTADAYRVGGFYSPYALVSQDKRLSDAELAAEYWHELVEAFSCDYADAWTFHQDNAGAIHRFATLPHFDA